MKRVAVIAIVVVSAACGHAKPVAFRRAQAFIEGDRHKAWALHVTLVASAKPNDDQLNTEMTELVRTYRGQPHLREIVADVVLSDEGEVVASATRKVDRTVAGGS